MARMLAKAGVHHPTTAARKLANEGIGAHELAFRLKVDTRPPARSKTRRKKLTATALKRLNVRLARRAGLKASDFDPRALAQGTRVEMEHTLHVSVARQIAMDHLTEDPDYYVKLARMERRL
jgi:hypothetical protein